MAAAEVGHDDGRGLHCHFTARLDDAWSPRRVHVVVTDVHGHREVHLEHDGRGWRRDGRPADELAGCTDVDVAATPLTNTFVLRRLVDLEPGAEQPVVVAWVDVPSLDVVPMRQAYTRLSGLPGSPAGRWRYADPTHGAFELVVDDDDGLVERYEGLAERIP